jgi:hypothetical protein
VFILGGAAIIALELSYRHAHMVSPASGEINTSPSGYAPAGSLSVVQGGEVEAQAG